MATSATFLHVTDTHIAEDGTPFARDDHKVSVPSIEQDSREGLLELLFRRLAERLASEGRRLDGVLFSGDAQDRGRPGGHKLLLDLVLKHFGPLGITPERIVATPGNHDVPRGTPPGSTARYAPFTSVWQAGGCVIPWLDGIDSSPAPARDGPHRLLDIERRWVVYPINSSNWSHVTSVLPEPLRSSWEVIPGLLSGTDAEKEKKLRDQLEGLAQYDMARVSAAQLEALRTIIGTTPPPSEGRQIRIAMLHHHLRAPSLREELKPFADISNLEHLRAFLRDNGIDVVLHGHKHEHAAQFEHIYDHDGERDHRTLVISGATFEVGREADALRLITLSGLPNTPTVTIERIGLPRGGVEIPKVVPIVRRLWATTTTAGVPVVIEGSNLDEVYERACAAASAEAGGGTLIVHLDLADDHGDVLPLPSSYPAPEALADDERQLWLKELVTWWQLDRSRLEHRIPYIHGSRLRRYGGKIDQLGRIIRLLRVKSTTRALAVLVDPFRDFGDGTGREEFASFCLVEFRRRDVQGGPRTVDAIAFYRAQEFVRWWPINVAELRYLQREICRALGYRPGRITTITADARTISRSPTQVAMPIIDRWLDQAPERLHLLANALVHRTVRAGPQREAVRDWQRTLSDLQMAASEYIADGVPIAIEGLDMLASYLEVAAEENDEGARSLARSLRDLARLNSTYETSAREPADFERWSPTALGYVRDLQRLTQARL
jgi:3',5'-cyclic AMP phosphodiesterase CpdA